MMNTKNILAQMIFIMFLFINSSVLAKNNKDFTLHCSYITAKTGLYITLKPITFKKNGDAYMEGKYIGKAYKADDNTLYLPMEKNALFSMDFDKWLSIYSISIDDKPIYNFGSCETTSIK